MSQKRTSALDVARRYLFEAQDGLNKAARVLSQHGTNADGLKDMARTAASMGRQVEDMKNRVRKAHEAALAAERGSRGGWGW